jgi:DNA invertase Pin-like site-specific DNA recombinase
MADTDKILQALERLETIVGLAAARARGKSGGRPKRSLKSSIATLTNKLYVDKANGINDIYKILNILRATLYKYIKEY